MAETILGKKGAKNCGVVFCTDALVVLWWFFDVSLLFLLLFFFSLFFSALPGLAKTMSDSAITLYIVPVVFSALPLIYEHVNGGGTGGNNSSGNRGNRSTAEVTVTYSSIQAANEWCLEIFQILNGLLGMF